MRYHSLNLYVEMHFKQEKGVLHTMTNLFQYQKKAIFMNKIFLMHGLMEAACKDNLSSINFGHIKNECIESVLIRCKQIVFS